MAVITTGAHPKALWPGVHKFFGAVYNKHPAEYRALFDIRPSDKNYEEVVSTYNFGLVPQKSEGGSTSYTSHAQNWVERFVHVAYSLGFIVTREEIADNQYSDKAFDRARHLSFSFNQTIENVGANVYNRAFNPSYLGGDSKEMCATDHPDAVGGTYSNELSTGADLTEAALEDLIIQIGQATDDVGLKISIRPRYLLIHTNDEFEACRILKSTLQNDTANNAINALRATGALPEGYKVNHYFTDGDAFFIRTNVMDGPILFTREGFPEPEFTRDNDFDTDNAKAKGYMRFSVGWANPRGVYASAGA